MQHCGVLWAGIVSSTLVFAATSPAQNEPRQQEPAQEQPAGSGPVAAGETLVEQEGSCFPSCRDGYVCHRNQCVSLCNPPCESGEVCVGGQRCEAAPREPAAPGNDVREPPPPALKGFAERAHTGLAFHWGLGGSYDRSGGSDIDLNNTYGLSIRSDAPIARYLLLGPVVQFGAWQPDFGANAAGRSFYIDLSLFLRARLPIEASKLNYQVWAGIPIGVTASILGEGHGRVQGLGPGWNFGLMLGGAVHFSKKWGLMAEVGWQQHRVHHPGMDSSIPAADIRLAQTIVNLGFIFRTDSGPKRF